MLICGDSSRHTVEMPHFDVNGVQGSIFLTARMSLNVFILKLDKVFREFISTRFVISFGYKKNFFYCIKHYLNLSC